jgi:hypothetical protein
VPQILVLIGDGQVIASAAICATVTLKEQVFVEQRLVAVQVTAVAPRPNVLPLDGVQPVSVPPLTMGLA